MYLSMYLFIYYFRFADGMQEIKKREPRLDSSHIQLAGQREESEQPRSEGGALRPSRLASLKRKLGNLPF